MVATEVKILDCRLFENPEIVFSKTFDSPKLPRESRILHCLSEKFHEYPHDITIRTLTTIPQHFS